MNYSGKKYALSLSDGSRWHLAGDEDLSLWLDRLAGILQLDNVSSSDRAEKIFFVRNSSPINCDHNFLLARWAHSAEKGAYLCEINTGECINDQTKSMMISLQPVYQKSIRNGGLPFHAALIETRGCGILLAAPGGTGKSTSCKRLPNNWKSVCDDECLVIIDNHGKCRAHPFPTWSDHLRGHIENKWNIQYSLPLCGIFFLEQSEIDEVLSLGEGEAAVYITASACQAYQRFYVNRDDMTTSQTKIFNNSCNLAKLLPAFRLRISLHGEFWKEIEESIF